MQCCFCGATIDPRRASTNGGFCTDEHRQLHEFAERVLLRLSQGQPLRALFPLTAWGLAKTRPAPPEGPAMAPLSLEPTAFGAKGEPRAWPLEPAKPDYVFAFPVPGELLPLNFEIAPVTGVQPGKVCRFEAPEALLATPLLPAHQVDPLAGRQTGEWANAALEAAKASPPATPVPRTAPAPVSWGRLREVWRNAPGDLKLLTTLLPVLLVLALIRTIPKVSAHTSPSANSTPGLVQMVNDKWKILRSNIMKRAGVEYVDDFRSGLDDWQGRTNLTAHWSYDAAGFVRPGALALYQPTLDLTDYRFEFLGEIDQKALGFVYRAADLDNYYVVKLVVAKPGPLPVVQMVRYSVIHGKEGPRQHKPLPFATRTDMLYRVRMEVRGQDFVLMAQDQVVDAWSDGALKKGGIGFFSGKGEQARIRWVEVTHQYDRLGRLCAYLTPGGPD
jgi:hypothetical protein